MVERRPTRMGTFDLDIPLGGWPLPGGNEKVEWFRWRVIVVQAGLRAVLVMRERERAVSGLSNVGLVGRPVCSGSFRDGNQRVPFLVSNEVRRHEYGVIRALVFWLLKTEVEGDFQGEGGAL